MGQERRRSTCSISTASSDSSRVDDDQKADVSLSSIMKDNNLNKMPHNKSVRFDTVEIREYPYILGDNPSVTNGPPLSLGWMSQSQFFVDFEEYDNAKPAPRTTYEMRFDEMLRLHILQSSGHSLNEIIQATAAVRKEQELRRQSIQSSMRAIRVEKTTRNVRSKLQGLQTFSNISKNSFSKMNMKKSRAARAG